MKKLVLSILVAQHVLLAPACFAEAQLFGKNLLKNGNAELGQGSTDGASVEVPGWTVPDGNLTVVKYGSTGGYPTTATAGPPTVGANARGKNFFSGGNAAKATANQEIDLSAAAEAIDKGNVRFELSAWLGGYEGQEDNTTVNVEFYDGEGNGTRDATIGPVTAAHRAHKTLFLFKKAAGMIPAGARKAIVTMKMVRDSGKSNDGYADHVSLVLTQQVANTNGAGKEASGK